MLKLSLFDYIFGSRISGLIYEIIIPAIPSRREYVIKHKFRQAHHNEPIIDQPLADEPDINEPVVDIPASDKPVINQLVDKPVSEL